VACVTIFGMGLRYFVETTAEARGVVDRLTASGYEAHAEPLLNGFVVHVQTHAPSVTIEEIVLLHARSARRAVSESLR